MGYTLAAVGAVLLLAAFAAFCTFLVIEFYKISGPFAAATFGCAMIGSSLILVGLIMGAG